MSDKDFEVNNPYISPRILRRTQRHTAGDRVVAIATVPLRDGERETSAVFPGLELTVAEVKGDWLRVDHGVGGWIERSHVIPADQAIRYFKRAIDRDRHNEVWYNALAHAFLNHGDLELAVGAYTGSIRRLPTDPVRWTWRGHARALRKDFLGAIADLNQASRLDPPLADAYNLLAWILATCAVADFRDGRLALLTAQKAVKLTGGKDAVTLDTLACAYAELGDYPQAVRYETDAVELASEKNRAACWEHLQLFQKGIPVRDDWNR